MGQVMVDTSVIWTDPHIAIDSDRIWKIVRNFEELEPEICVHRPDWERFHALINADNPIEEYSDPVFDSRSLAFFGSQSPHGSEYRYIRVAFRINQMVKTSATEKTRALFQILKAAKTGAPHDSFFYLRYVEHGRDLSDLDAVDVLSWSDFLPKEFQDKTHSLLWNGPKT